jgi:putative spermidine/putrescine transport system permease protein
MEVLCLTENQVDGAREGGWKQKIATSAFLKSLRTYALVLPLLAFIFFSFLLPISLVLFRSIENPEISMVLPDVAKEFNDWKGEGLPTEELVQTFVRSVRMASENQSVSIAATRLNFEIPGFRSLLLKTARQLPDLESPNILANLIEVDDRWGDVRYWIAIKRASPRYTLGYLLAVVDLKFDQAGSLTRVAEDQRIYLPVLGRTLWISLVVTTLCFILGYPVAALLASQPTRRANHLMLLLLLPFWTSLLVRTTAWMVLLQDNGVINDLGIQLGIWSEPIQLIRNRLGVYIAMTHILLPFMILPIFSVMKGIPSTHLKAAASLGAGPVRAFAKVYFPQTAPGVGAGALLVFILSLGYYITPALVGGPRDQMLSYFVAFNANSTLNWGIAAALSLELLICIAIFFSVYSRFVGVERLRVN